MLFLLNALIAFLCEIIAAILFAGGSYSACFAYAGFGIGYLGLAALYAGL